MSIEVVNSLPKGLPERTLGEQVLVWCSEWIRQPDGPDAGGPWRFTREQVLFVLHWYAVDHRGRWLYNRGVLRRAKGWGKSPVVSALALAELCGPVRFGGWDARGEPVGVSQAAAWVQLAGVSEKQTTNTMSMVLAMVAESPMVDEYGLDVGLTRIFTAAGGRLEPITASAPTAEGARPSFVIQDETHHWTDSNGGTKLDRVNRRNLGKSRDGSARMLETTNAHAIGEQSVAERSHEAYLAIREGRSRATGLLYDSREALGVDLADDDELMQGLAIAYGDSTWVDLERIRDEVLDIATPPEDSRRFYLNELAAANDAWLSEIEWAGCADPTAVVADQERVVLGFDGSRKRKHAVTDATALVGCRVSDGLLFVVGCWEEPNGPAAADWQVPTTEVDAAVASAFDRWDVVGFYADPALWESHIVAWEARYSKRLVVKATADHPVQWWMSGSKAVMAVERFKAAVLDQELRHDGDYTLTRHVLNARRRESRFGWSIAKEHPQSARKIDAAMAGVLAWQARLDAVAVGGRKKQPGNVVAWGRR